MNDDQSIDDFPEEENGDEFDELDALSEHGRFWNPRKSSENNHPHKLVLRAIRWETTTSQFNDEERDVIVGQTKTGETWKIACDNLDLQPLHTGDVKQWNDEKQVFEVVANWGQVSAGEIFAVEYRGDRSYTNKQGKQVTTGSYRYTRKPPAGKEADDDIPFS